MVSQPALGNVIGVASMKRLCGLLAAMVGLTGIVLSALGALYVLRIGGWLDRNAQPRLAKVEETLAFLSAELQATQSNLDAIKVRLEEMHPDLEELARREGRGGVPDSLRQSLERSVIAPLQNTEDMMLSAEQTMRSLSNAALVLDSVPLFSLKRGGGPAGGERPLKTVAGNLEESANSIRQMLQSLGNIRAGQNLSPEHAARPLKALTQLQSALGSVEGHVEEMSARFEEARANVAWTRQSADRWILYGRVIAMLVCVCFGFSQASLLLQGCRAVAARSIAIRSAE
jgi:hypothetical protein